MKTLLEAMHNLKEAKHSSLKKIKNRDQDIHYEPVEGDYEHVPFDYVLEGGDYEGYIDDKKGKRYTLIASHDESDTGHIAGGTMDYNVSIAYGEHKINLSDYTAIFSSHDGPGYRLISNLEDGMYLEDYLQKYLDCVSSISNIEDWVAKKKEAGNDSSNWSLRKLWIQENIINDNGDYDERTDKQKKIDKRNEKDFVKLNSDIPVYIEGNEIKIAKDLKKTKYKYTGEKGYWKYTRTDDSIEVKKDTPLLLDNTIIQEIIKKVTTSPEKGYDFEIILDDLRNVTLELDGLDSIFQLTNKGLKFVYSEFSSISPNIYYSSREGYNRCAKLDDLMQQAKINLNKNYYMPRLYTEIQSRLGGAKESIVEIVYDYGKHEYRAQGDDGEHGKAWVQFPKDLRQRDKKYKVDQLIWNGKNYRAKGNIEEV